MSEFSNSESRTIATCALVKRVTLGNILGRWSKSVMSILTQLWSRVKLTVKGGHVMGQYGAMSVKTRWYFCYTNPSGRYTEA